MRHGPLAAGFLVAALAIAKPALADVTVDFHFSGGGINTSGTLTYDPSMADAISGGFAVTGITGVFSDSNIGITNDPISGLVASTGNATPAGTAPFPTAMSYFFVQNGVNDGTPNAAPFASYDNLYYPDGSPIVCTGYNGAGGTLDVYGLLFGIEPAGSSVAPGAGLVVDLFSNGFNSGFLPPGVPVYGAAVVDSINQYDYVSAGIAAPEPTTWAMLLIGFAGLGFAGARKVRAVASGA